MNLMSLKSRSSRSTILSSIAWEDSGDAPIDLPKAKTWMKVEDTEDDALITSLIEEIIDLVENSYNFTIIDKTVTAVWESFGDKIILPMAPVKAVTSVSLVDSEGVKTALEIGSDFYVNGNIIYFNTTASSNLLEVIYTAGWEEVPGGIIVGLKKAIMSAYEDRQDVAEMGVNLIPGNSRALFKKYRRF